MRLPIDECVDERLRLLFPGHDCQTARFANLAGLKNGVLLEADEARFDVLITVDQNIPDQQNLVGRTISSVISADQRTGCAIWSYWCPPRFPRYIP
jgi:hypothetical protein